MLMISATISESPAAAARSRGSAGTGLTETGVEEGGAARRPNMGYFPNSRASRPLPGFGTALRADGVLPASASTSWFST